MKRIVTILLVAVSSLCMSQSSYYTAPNTATEAGSKQKSKDWKFRPYLSPGVSMSTGVPCYGMEIGVYTDKIWLASTTETYRNSDTKKYDVLQGLRFYYLYATPVKDRLFLYANVAGKVTCNKTKVLIFEPGTCVVYSPHKNIGIQWGISFPIPETITTSKVFPFSTGLCFNVYL